MRFASIFAATALAMSLAACSGPNTPGTTAPDPAAVQAATDVVVAQALAARDAEAVKIHGAAGPMVYFVNLRDGMTVPQSFRVVFGASGIGVAPALTDKPNTGHHHLLIDAELSDEEKQFAIPNDEQHMHFGGGQTEVVLQLSPGPHTLQLAFGDLNHELHKPTPIMSEKITVNVQ
ncbi:MAG: DUF4399 domain-containing protein [Hyphomonadaceae bacterium]|jgi:hypothetical protein